MTTKRLSLILFILFVLSVSLLFLPFSSTGLYAAGAQAGHEGGHEDALPGEVPVDVPVEAIKQFIAPMNELEIFPCSDCHDADWKPNPQRRDLDEPHSEIPGKFMNHDSENRWCLDCHSAKTRDKLQLLNGTLIEFNEYYRLCEQCHKRIYREWKMGVHGKRTGHWNGEKQWMHCAQCHNPHNPPFKAIQPEPAPRKPLETWSGTAKAAEKTADTQH